MSEFRRNIIITNSGESSWYRICEGGIYTTTNAYINTGYSGWTSRYTHTYADVKILANTANIRRIFGSVGNIWYYVHFTGESETSVEKHCYGFPGSTRSSLTDIYNYQPFLNKKVRVHFPKFESTSTNAGSIQIWTENQLGTHIYNRNRVSYMMNWADRTAIYPMCFLAMMNGGSVNNSQVANYMSIYNAYIENNDNLVFSAAACQLTQNISADLAWDNKPHQKGEYGMYDSVSGKFFGNANTTGYFLENFD